MTYFHRLFRPIRRAYLRPGTMALIVPTIVVNDPNGLLKEGK